MRLLDKSWVTKLLNDKVDFLEATLHQMRERGEKIEQGFINKFDVLKSAIS